MCIPRTLPASNPGVLLGFLDESVNDFIVLQLLLCVNHFVALESGRRFRFI